MEQENNELVEEDVKYDIRPLKYVETHVFNVIQCEFDDLDSKEFKLIFESEDVLKIVNAKVSGNSEALENIYNHYATLNLTETITAEQLKTDELIQRKVYSYLRAIEFRVSYLVEKVTKELYINQDEEDYRDQSINKYTLPKKLEKELSPFDSSVKLKDCKIFISPNAKILRKKVRDWGESVGVQITYKPESADMLFLSDVDFTIESPRYNVMKRENLVSSEELDSLLDKLSNSVITNDTVDLIRNSEELLFTNYSLPNNYEQFYKLEHVRNMQYFCRLKYPDLKAYLESGAPMYSVENLIEIVNNFFEIEITSETYDNLRNLCGSDDSANIELAIEMIANSDMKYSIPYVLLIFSEFGGKMRYSKEYNNTNFKSYRVYLEKNYNINLDYFNQFDSTQFQYFMDNKLITYSFMKSYAKYFKDMLIQQFSLTSQGSAVFQVDKLTVSDEVKEYFKNNPKLAKL